MLEIYGTYQAGTGTAHDNLQTQLRLIAKEFPEIQHCHPGTINLRLDGNLFVMAPDHRTRPIHWDVKGFPTGEIFDFLRVSLELPMGSTSFDAWLYIAHGSPHRSTSNVHEVIAPFRTGITYTQRCKLLINRKAFSASPVELPFLNAGTYVY